MKSHLTTSSVGAALGLALALITNASATEVTFQVNLKIQKALGNFDPRSHTAEARGSFDGWGAGITLSASAGDANVYEGTVDVDGAAGAPYEYKFMINKGASQSWEGNVGPGGPNGNRTFTLPENPLVLPVVYFDNLETDPGAGIPVTFQVDLAVQIAQGNFDPDAGTVFVAGPFNDWKPDVSALVPGIPGSTVYRGMVKIKSAAGSSVPYKFVVNGTGWEANDNRLFTLAAPTQTLPPEFFNRVDNLGPLTVSGSGNGEVTLSWTAGPRIRLQGAAGPGAQWQDVPDSLGLDTINVPGSEPIRVFRLVGP